MCCCFPCPGQSPLLPQLPQLSKLILLALYPILGPFVRDHILEQSSLLSHRPRARTGREEAVVGFVPPSIKFMSLSPRGDTRRWEHLPRAGTEARTVLRRPPLAGSSPSLCRSPLGLHAGVDSGVKSPSPVRCDRVTLGFRVSPAFGGRQESFAWTVEKYWGTLGCSMAPGVAPLSLSFPSPSHLAKERS